MKDDLILSLSRHLFFVTLINLCEQHGFHDYSSALKLSCPFKVCTKYPCTCGFFDILPGKHFLNKPETLIVDSLKGLCATNPQLALDVENKSMWGRGHFFTMLLNSRNSAVYIANQDCNKVALLCGGGSGHEPAHAGFVGKRLHFICRNLFNQSVGEGMLTGLLNADQAYELVLMTSRSGMRQYLCFSKC